MTNFLKFPSYIVLFIIVISCVTNKMKNIKSVYHSNVNTILNMEYYNSKKSFNGNLTDSEYKYLINNIEKELKVIIPNGKSILINYSQKATNCISLKLSTKKFSKIIDNGVRISSRICLENNTIDFFVYAANSFHNELYQNRDDFILDSGFFYNNVFTLHENCNAFLIIKPNGDFLKFYGEDYYSEVRVFLEKK